MSFQKYLQIINQIDAGKIYVENVRHFLNTSVEKARIFCEMAVQEKIFTRKIGLVCPNDNRIIQEYNDISEIPNTITCGVCEADGIERYSFNTADLKRITFYSIKK